MADEKEILQEEEIEETKAPAAPLKKKKLRAGQIAVAIEEEEILWKDRKRVTIFGLPWTFTRYSLTPSKLIIDRGFWKRTEEEVRLYRIKDISYSQTLGERIAGTGTLTIISNDSTIPSLMLVHIKKAKLVKDVISQSVELSRRANGVRTSEVISNVGAHGGHAPNDGHTPEEHAALGPELFPDVNGDGIDDREQ